MLISVGIHYCVKFFQNNSESVEMIGGSMGLHYCVKFFWWYFCQFCLSVFHFFQFFLFFLFFGLNTFFMNNIDPKYCVCCGGPLLRPAAV